MLFLQEPCKREIVFILDEKTNPSCNSTHVSDCTISAFSSLTRDSNTLPSVTRRPPAGERNTGAAPQLECERAAHRPETRRRRGAPPPGAGVPGGRRGRGKPAARGNPKPAPFPTPPLLPWPLHCSWSTAALASFILSAGTGVEFVRFTSLRPLLGRISESGNPGEQEDGG